MDCSLPRSSVHGILQARVLEWVSIPFSKGSSQHRDWTWVSCIAGKFFTVWATIWCEIRKPEKSILPRHTPLTSFLHVLPEIDYAYANIKYVSCFYFLNAQNFIMKRTWQSAPVFLPGESRGQGSLVGCSPWGCKELNVNEVTEHRDSISCMNVPQFIKSSIDEHFIFLDSKITAVIAAMKLKDASSLEGKLWQT